MKLKEKTLVEWLSKQRKNSFPGRGNIDYYRRFQGIDEYLNTRVHPFVNATADAVDRGTLTDHGPEHIKMVILRASALAAHGADLSAYEVYLLLVAIHLHDVGNLFGRDTHVMNNEVVVKKLGLLMGDDLFEQKAIKEIAQAHGGSVEGDLEGDKDKISRLPARDNLLGHSVRHRTLAAILRFADELADERARAAGFLMELRKICKTSEIYHQYAYSLHSVVVDAQGEQISLEYAIPFSDACNTFGKGASNVFLLDEIFERTMKMHQERIYCMRFLRPMIAIEQINVRIRVYSEDFNKLLATIPYRLEESGYPDIPPGGVLMACPSVSKLEYGAPLTGEKLRDFLTGQVGEPR